MKDIDLITKKPTEEIVLETKCSETVETLKTEPAVVLSKRIDNEISRATEAEKNLDSKIDAETTRATAREDELESKIKQSGKVDDVLVNDDSVLGEDKIARIDLTPYAKQSDLSSEIDRAKEAESSLSSSLDIVKSDLTSETSARESADKTLQTNIDANEEAITAETTRATTKETELENAIKEAGKIDDVKVNDVSVVTDKVANIDLTSYAKTSDLSSYVKKSGDTMTGTLNVPTIEGVSTMTFDANGTIKAAESLVIDVKRPRLTKINGASLNYSYQFPVLNPTDSALCTTGGNLTYNGKTKTLAVSNINSGSSSDVKTISTGTNASSYFQSQKFRGQGNASTYNHAIDFGYAGHDRVDFYEYGGVYNFWQNQGSSKLEGDKNRVASLQLGKLLERGYTLTYPGKSGTFALTSDFADYATTAYVDEKTALPKITITKDQFTSSKSIKLTDEQNAILIDTNNDAVLVDLSSFEGTYPNIVLHRQISSAWLLLLTSVWNAELLILENGVTRLKKFLVLTGINDGVQPNYPTADIVDLDTIDFPTITLSKSQVTSVSEDGNSMALALTENQYNILCDSLYRAVKVNASNIGLWNDGVIYKLNDDSTDPVYTFFSVSASEAGIGRIFIDSDRTAKVYITYAVSQEEASQLKEEITTQLTNLQTDLSIETKTREESDNTLQTNLNQEIADRKTSDSDLNITITNSLTEAKAYTDSEAKLREQGDADTLSSAKSYIDKMIEQSLLALSVDGGEVTA